MEVSCLNQKTIELETPVSTIINIEHDTISSTQEMNSIDDNYNGGVDFGSLKNKHDNNNRETEEKHEDIIFLGNNQEEDADDGNKSKNGYNDDDQSAVPMELTITETNEAINQQQPSRTSSTTMDIITNTDENENKDEESLDTKEDSSSSNTPTSENNTKIPVYRNVYNGVAVFEMFLDGYGIMRRERDNYVNATHLLTVAGLSKGQRTKVLDQYTMSKPLYERVQGGYGRYQGTWVPKDEGINLARKYLVEDLILPLLEATAKTVSPSVQKKPYSTKKSSSPVKNNAGASAANGDDDDEIDGKKSSSPSKERSSTSSSSQKQQYHHSTRSTSASPVKRKSSSKYKESNSSNGTDTSNDSNGSPTKSSGSKNSNKNNNSRVNHTSTASGDFTLIQSKEMKMVKHDYASIRNLKVAPAAEAPVFDKAKHSNESPIYKSLSQLFSSSSSVHNHGHNFQNNGNDASNFMHTEKMNNSKSSAGRESPKKFSNRLLSAERRTDFEIIEEYIRHHRELPFEEKQAKVIMNIYSDGDQRELYALLCQPSSSSSNTLNFDVDMILDEFENTPLHWSVSIAAMNKAYWLLGHGADASRVNAHGETLLMRAISSVQNSESSTFLELIRLFQECVYQADHLGRTLLHHLILSFDQLDNLNASNYYLNSFMNWLSHQDSPNFIKMFLAAQDHEGNTALHLAYQSKNEKVVHLLIERGCPEDIRNQEDRLAIEMM